MINFIKNIFIAQDKPIFSNKELLKVLCDIPGFILINNYVSDQWYIHFEANSIALHGICELSAAINASVQVYEYSKIKFRYTLVINSYSRETLEMYFEIKGLLNEKDLNKS